MEKQKKLEKIVTDFAQEMKSVTEDKRTNRKATLEDCQVNAHRITEIDPFIAKMSSIGFNAPLELGGYKNMQELVNYVLVCTEEEFSKLMSDARELVRCFGGHSFH